MCPVNAGSNSNVDDHMERCIGSFNIASDEDASEDKLYEENTLLDWPYNRWNHIETEQVIVQTDGAFVGSAWASSSEVYLTLYECVVDQK